MISLVERPNPRWSVMSVQQVIQAKSVPLELLDECVGLDVLTDKFRRRAQARLEAAPKAYILERSLDVTPHIKRLQFRLQGSLELRHPALKPYAFANIKFGQPNFSRPYSIVAGDLNAFTLGVALDDNSRGGSEYLHKRLQVGDEITMFPGSNLKPSAHDEIRDQSGSITHGLVIVGGIGVTAFLPFIQT